MQLIDSANDYLTQHAAPNLCLKLVKFRAGDKSGQVIADVTKSGVFFLPDGPWVNINSITGGGSNEQ